MFSTPQCLFFFQSACVLLYGENYSTGHLTFILPFWLCLSVSHCLLFLLPWGVCYNDTFILNMLFFIYLFFLLGRSEIGISILNLNLNDNSATNNRTKSVFRWIYQCMIHISYDWEIDFHKWISDPASLNINATEICTVGPLMDWNLVVWRVRERKTGRK